MGWLSKLLGSGIGDATSGIGDLAKDVRQAITGELPADLKIKLEELTLESDKAQTELIKADIESGSLFQRGWRPLAGWVCSISLGYQYVALPVLKWASLNFGIIPPPDINNMEVMIPLLIAMLGLTFSRTYEKIVKCKHSNGNKKKE